MISGLEYGIQGYEESGFLFLKNADEYSAFFLTGAQKNIMYGETFSSVFAELKDFAIYISASTPYEIAVFESYSKNGTYDILRMCYERADTIKVALRFTEWESASQGIAITVYKKYVIFAFTESLDRSEGSIEAIITAFD